MADEDGSEKVAYRADDTRYLLHASVEKWVTELYDMVHAYETRVQGHIAARVELLAAIKAFADLRDITLNE